MLTVLPTVFPTAADDGNADTSGSRVVGGMVGSVCAEDMPGQYDASLPLLDGAPQSDGRPVASGVHVAASSPD